ncbi:MAG: hypothetical protein ACFFB3_20090 [Candidatus Hodarchaeota archaeon]
MSDDRLRDVLPESFNEFFDNIMNLIILALDPIFKREICPIENRIGVFGSYKDRGKDLLTNLGKIFSSGGYGVVTGHGYFKPNDENLHSLSDITPAQMEKFRDNFRIPSFVFYQHYPRLISRGVFHLTDSRGEGTEAIGCYIRKIPMAGFIIAEKISSKKKWCNFLIPFNEYVECTCPDKSLCFYPSLKPYCPFYEEVDVPWEIKELFLTVENRLFAVRDPDHLIDFFKNATPIGDKETDFSLLA